MIYEIDIRSFPGGGDVTRRVVISQAGIRYIQANLLVESLLLDKKFNELSILEKRNVSTRILNEIKGRMMEDIVLLETKISNPYKDVFTLQFSIGEFDMVVFDKETLSCEIYEIKHSKEVIDKQYGLYLTDDKSMYQECEFSFKEFSDSSLFGLLFNVEHYSSHPCNPDPSFVGYVVGFKNGLMVVGYANYGFTMVYDKPVKIELNKKYLLSAKVKDSKIEVFLDNKKIIETTLPYSSTYGQVGMYVNNFAKVNIHSYRRKKHEEV